MTKFILVHEPTGNDTCKPVLVNVDRIEYCCMGNKGKDTYLKLIGPALADERDKVKASFFFVKESLEEIQALVSNATKLDTGAMLARVRG